MPNRVVSRVGRPWAVLLLSSLAAAPRAQQAAAPEAARLAADVAWLADDAREGRRSGEPGCEAAAEWLGARLAALGLEPAGEQHSFFQRFEIELPARDGGESWLEWSSPVAFGAPAIGQPDDRLQPRVTGASRVVPLFCSEAGQLASQQPIVFAGYGLVNAERGRDDYAGLDVQGRVVLIARGAPPAPAESAPASAGAGAAAPGAAAGADTARVGADPSWGSSAALLYKVIAAKQRGAAAVIVGQLPSQANERLLAFDPGQGGRAGIPALMVAAAVAEELAPGYSARLRALDRGLDPSEGLHGLASSVRLSADVRRERGSTRNVLGLLRGSERGRAVVVGAHYDHLGHGGQGALDPRALGQVHNGADDNASGSAAVLEIARLLRAGPAPRGDVLFALWSGEEEGLLGSQHWSEHPTLPLEQLRANLNLDMVGRAGAGVLQVLGVGTSPAFEAWMKPAGERAGLELQPSLSGQGLGSSDHQSFLAKGIPALHLFSGSHADYHRPSDDAERVDAAGMAKVAALSLDLIARMQAADALPYSKPAAEQGAEPGRKRGGWTAWFGSVPDYAFAGPGVRINGTSPGSPAERAGFLPGDVLRRMADVELGGLDDFMYALSSYHPGNVVLVRFERAGKLEETRVTLGTRAAQ